MLIHNFVLKNNIFNYVINEISGWNCIFIDSRSKFYIKKMTKISVSMIVILAFIHAAFLWYFSIVKN